MSATFRPTVAAGAGSREGSAPRPATRSTGAGSRTCLVIVADLSLVAEAVATALAAQGFKVQRARLAPGFHPPPCDDVEIIGLMMSELGPEPHLQLLSEIISESGLRWVVLSASPRGPA